MTTPRLAHKTSDVPILGRVGHIDQVVRHAAPLGPRCFGRTDVHPPVDLHRVGGNDLDVPQLEGYQHTKSGLSRSSRPHQGEGA